MPIAFFATVAICLPGVIFGLISLVQELGRRGAHGTSTVEPLPKSVRDARSGMDTQR